MIMGSHLVGGRRDEHHPDRRDVVTKHDGDDNNPDWPAGTLELIQALRNYSHRTEVSPQWRTDNHLLPANDAKCIAHRRLQRKRALVWADPANTGPVFLSSTTISNDPTGSSRTNTVKLPPGGASIELTTPGDIYVFTPTAGGQQVYVLEEFLET